MAKMFVSDSTRQRMYKIGKLILIPEVVVKLMLF